MKTVPLTLGIVTATFTVLLADATIPTADRKGSKDNPLLKRALNCFVAGREASRWKRGRS
jgi:hypothetical protein